MLSIAKMTLEQIEYEIQDKADKLWEARNSGASKETINALESRIYDLEMALDDF